MYRLQKNYPQIFLVFRSTEWWPFETRLNLKLENTRIMDLYGWWIYGPEILSCRYWFMQTFNVCQYLYIHNIARCNIVKASHHSKYVISEENIRIFH